MILPAPDGTCQDCAVAHPEDQPHDKTSLYYQSVFRSRQGRWPTWRDALAHCPEEIADFWEKELRARDAWDGWEGENPPAPDVCPTPGRIGTVRKMTLDPHAPESEEQ